MHVDEKQALVAAQRAVGFPVGHASAQQVWHGLRSRPDVAGAVLLGGGSAAPARARARRRRRRTGGRAPRRGQPRGVGARRTVRDLRFRVNSIDMFDGKFRTPIDKAVKPIGDGLRRTGLTPDHLTIVGLRRRRRRRVRDRRRRAAARPAARDPRRPARPARRSARQGVGRVEPARRVLRLDRRPAHRRVAARWHRLVPGIDTSRRTCRSCRSR